MRFVSPFLFLANPFDLMVLVGGIERSHVNFELGNGSGESLRR